MPQAAINPQLSRQATGGSNMLNTLRALVSLLPGAFPPEAGRGSSLRPETEAPLNEPSLQDVPLILMLGGLMGRGRGAEVFGEDLISALRRALRTEAVARKDARRVEEVGEEGMSELERFFRRRDPETVEARSPERVPFGERSQEALSRAREAGRLPADIVAPDEEALPGLLNRLNVDDAEAVIEGVEVQRFGDPRVLRIGDPIVVRSGPERLGRDAADRTIEHFVVPYERDQFAVIEVTGLGSAIKSLHADRGSAIARAQANVIQLKEMRRLLEAGDVERALKVRPAMRGSALNR